MKKNEDIKDKNVVNSVNQNDDVNNNTEETSTLKQLKEKSVKFLKTTKGKIVYGVGIASVILGGIFVGLAVAIWLTTGGKHYNDRNLYDKIVEGCEDITIEHIYECLSSVDTCLGCPWMGSNTFTSGDAIMFGPSPFKDYITIYKDKKNNIVVI